MAEEMEQPPESSLLLESIDWRIKMGPADYSAAAAATRAPAAAATAASSIAGHPAAASALLLG